MYKYFAAVVQSIFQVILLYFSISFSYQFLFVAFFSATNQLLHYYGQFTPAYSVTTFSYLNT